MASELRIAKEKKAQAIQSKRRISEHRAALDKEEARLDVVIEICSEIIEEASKHCDVPEEHISWTTKDYILHALSSAKSSPAARQIYLLIRDAGWTTTAEDPMSVIFPELSRMKNELGLIANNGDEKYTLTMKGAKAIRDKE